MDDEDDRVRENENYYHEYIVFFLFDFVFDVFLIMFLCLSHKQKMAWQSIRNDNYAIAYFWTIPDVYNWS